MKKLLALLLAMAMLVTLAACGGEKTEKSDKSDKDKDTDTPATVEGTEIKTPLFTLIYDDSVWVNLEDDMSEEADYCFVNLQVKDPEDTDYYLIDAEIEVSLEEPYDFRESLVYYGFEQYAYAEEDAYDTVSIGGYELLQYDDGDEKLVYLGRIEGAGATVMIRFDAVDIDDDRIEALLEGLTLELEDIGNEDGPWAWEGEPFSTTDHSVAIGSFTLNSTFVPFESYVDTYEVFNHSVAAIGDRVYILSEGQLIECHYDGSVLAFVNPIDLPEDDYEQICATADGSLWVSGSMNDILRIQNGAIVNTYEDIDNLAMHPSGAWGINYFVSGECSIVTFSGDSYNETPINFTEVDTIMHLCIDENNIYACASAADDSGHKVFVYDKDGVLQKTLCDAEGESLGSITFVTQTANGYIGFDGNMRDVILWDNSGAYIGDASDGDLFDTGYPWFCASTVLSDGSILTLMTDEREDRSATELLVFLVKGF